MNELANYIDWQDALALFYFLACWGVYARYSSHKLVQGKNLLAATNRYRLLWMREMLKRDNRSMDTITVGNVQRSMTFLASTTIFILFGLMTMLNYREHVSGIIEQIPFAKPTNGFLWEIKIFLLIIIFIYAFFKFTWSLRQYNYLGIFIAAMPNHKERIDEHEALARQGTALVANAASHFNNGLRGYYFGLAVLAWFVHPWLFMAATTLVVCVTFRREFHSATLKYLSQ